MRVGLFGKGRLGSAIAAAGGERIAWTATREDPPDVPVDVAIDVSAGAAVPARLAWALERGTPLVVGSTGWDLRDLELRVAGRIGVLVAPNFSLGVALYRRMVAVLARFAALDPERDPYILEHHHARKLDAPSGTAKLLAETILENCPRKRTWTTPLGAERLRPDELSVSAVRAGTTWSSHTVGLDAPGEVLELRHEARDARPYAEGALAAAEWLIGQCLVGKRGCFTMEHVAADLVEPLFRGSRT